jgi:hypothetical protein
MGCIPSKTKKTPVVRTAVRSATEPISEGSAARTRTRPPAQTPAVDLGTPKELACTLEADLTQLKYSPRNAEEDLALEAAAEEVLALTGTTADELLALARVTAADELVALPDGRALTGRGMLIEAINLDPANDRAYDWLALVLCANETVTLLDGRTMTSIGLWLEAQRLNPSEPWYYVGLSKGIGMGKEITLRDGRVLSQTDLLLEAVRVAPWDGYSHTCLAMDAPEPVTLPDGRVMSKRDLLIDGFRKSPQTFFCMVCLAQELSDETLLDLNVTQRQLYLDAIDLFPTEGLAYACFAATLKAGETVRLRDGRMMQREQLWSAAINVARYPAGVFAYLNVTLDSGETIIIDGQKWSRVDACLKAIAFEPTDGALHCVGQSHAVGQQQHRHSARWAGTDAPTSPPARSAYGTRLLPFVRRAGTHDAA